MQSSRLLTALKRTQALTPIAFRPAALAQQTTRAFAAHAKPTDAKHDAGHGAGANHDDHGHGAHHGVEFEGLTLTPPKRWHTVGAHFFGGLMWFWLLYRFSNDYKVFLGLEHPWDGHHGGDHAEHGHADEHDEKKHH